MNQSSSTPVALEENVPVDIDSVLKASLEKFSEIKRLADATRTTEAATLEIQRTTTAVLSDAQSKIAEISFIATEAVAAKTKLLDAQSVISTKSQHIEDAQKHADQVRANLDRLQTGATQQATEVEGQKSRAQSAADTTAELLAGVRTTKELADKDSAATTAARKLAEGAAAATQSLAEKSATVEERITAYEAKLADLESQCSAQMRTIESLLPGATSTGLAYAFDQRRQTFLKPQRAWQVVFVLSVIALVGLGATGLWHIHNMDSVPTYDELIRLWLGRLPIVGALVWLALYASRESALAKRLEEDYGYKSAISACFEGFRKQMSETGKGATAESPVGKLCSDTLRTIANPPGRIYDKHKLTISPTSELTDTAKAVKEAVKV